MRLMKNTYGKGRVRVLRVDRSSEQHAVRELSIKVMLTGNFAPAYTSKDNSTSVSTDTIKNVVNVVAHEQIGTQTEPFLIAITKRFFESYPQIDSVTVTSHETKWTRMTENGKPSPYGFLLDGNGKATAEVFATREKTSVKSGVAGFTFLKTTESGWDNYVKDKYTTIVETRDRICSTSMDAWWIWTGTPADYAASSEKLLKTMLHVFTTTYSESVQDSLFRMGSAGLETIPEIGEISMACPNKHYLLMNLAPFQIDNKLAVFLPTDEPHGQIECVVGR